MNLFVLRHGQTDLNIQGRFQGRIDTDLNKTGIEQVEKSKEILKEIPFDLVFVSPLKRAIDTAKLVTNCSLRIENRIIERSFGKLEGKLSVPDYEERADFYGVESKEEIKNRVFDFLNELTDKYSDKKNILIVTHEAVAQYINLFFNKIKNVKDFRLPTGSFIKYKIIDEELLMKKLEDIEINRNLLDVKSQNLIEVDKEKCKIHIVYLMVWTKVCGGSKIILEYANKLSKRGHKITLISYDNKPNWFELDDRIEFIQVEENEKIENNIPACDLIIATSWKNIYSAIKSNIAPVSFFEQGGSHIFDIDGLSEIKFKTVKSRFDLLSFIHTVSSYTKDEIRKVYGKESEVICNAINENIFFPRTNFEKNNDITEITIIGSENFKFKNINESLEAIRILKKKFNINLNWISQDTPKQNPENAIVNPKQIEIGNILRKTDIFLCNSEYESFCLPALEAMSCGACVITTDNGGIRDFVINDYNALIIEKHNQKDLIQKIEYLINNPEQRIKLQENGVITSKEFSWEKSTMKMEKYYKDLFLPSINQNLIDKSMENWLDNLANIFEHAAGFKQYFGAHFHDDRVLTKKYTMLYHSVKNLSDY